MIFDVNIDQVEDILAIRRAIIQGSFVDSGGMTTVSWTSEGTSVTKQFTISPLRLLEETKLFLQEYDPDLYGKRITRTVPAYLY